MHVSVVKMAAVNLTTRVYIASQFCNDVIHDLKKLNDQIEYFTLKFKNADEEGVNPNLIITQDDLDFLSPAEILITDNNLIDQLAYKLPNLKWIQGTFAGVDRPIKTLNDETFKNKGEPSFVVTRFSGECYGNMFVDYIVSFMIAIQRGFVDHILNRHNRDWAQMKQLSPSVIRNLNEVKFAILGVGAIGSFVAQQLNARGCTIFGYGLTEKTEQFIQSACLTSYSTDLQDIIADADCIVSILPHTDRTIGLLDGKFSFCKKSPVFINVGRGSVISEHYLAQALDSKLISMAVLDVFQPEPPSVDSILWTHPKVIITPHIASETRTCDLAKVFMENLSHFLKGEKLNFTVDWHSGY